MSPFILVAQHVAQRGAQQCVWNKASAVRGLEPTCAGALPMWLSGEPRRLSPSPALRSHGGRRDPGDVRDPTRCGSSPGGSTWYPTVREKLGAPSG